jgi:glutathione synthase/RimK-type ligase-like ATP-grasp enzyme
MTKSLLILAMDHDIHADAVHDRVTCRGYKSYRLDPELVWTPSDDTEADDDWSPLAKLDWSLAQNGHAAWLSWHDQKIDLTNVGAVFCRSFQFARADDDAPIDSHLRFAEMRAGLYGALRTLDACFWMNQPWLEDIIDNKMVQGRDAIRFGLSIPRTLVTNSEQQAHKFIESCNNGTIIKQLSEIGLIDDNPGEPETYGFYTSLVTDEAIENLSEVACAPCLFQEAIIKKADIRVTVVGEKVFAHRIASQSNPASATDFRKDPNLPTETFDFPEETGKALLGLLKFWGMEFAACDFALTPDDRLIFFEANVAGNWLWLEGIEHHPILDEIVDNLLRYLD